MASISSVASDTSSLFSVGRSVIATPCAERFEVAPGLAAVLAVPAFAIADKPADKPGKPDTPAAVKKNDDKGKGKGKGHAYGKLCQGQSKKHVKGQKGTPFSQCVRAMAKIDSGKTTSPRSACKGLSKKHRKGKKGTPFSRCVKAARQLKEQREEERTGGDESYADPFAKAS